LKAWTQKHGTYQQVTRGLLLLIVRSDPLIGPVFILAEYFIVPSTNITLTLLASAGGVAAASKLPFLLWVFPAVLAIAFSFGWRKNMKSFVVGAVLSTGEICNCRYADTHH
jgi:hypothetical protein